MEWCRISHPGNNISWVQSRWRLICLCLERSVKIKKWKVEKIKMQDGVRRATQWILFLVAFIYPNSKRKGKTKDFFTTTQGTNKVITFLMPKVSSNHTPGQNSQLVAIPWIKLLVITLRSKNRPELSNCWSRWNKSTWASTEWEGLYDDSPAQTEELLTVDGFWQES